MWNKRAYDVEWQSSIEAGRTRALPISDPAGASWRSISNAFDWSGLNLDSMVRYGVIVESFPYISCYRVQTEFHSTVICSYLGRTGFLAYGCREIQVLPPGTGVYYIQHPTTMNHVIVGVTNPAVINPRDARSDYISQGSNVGLNVDKTHNYKVGFKQSPLIDFSAGRPVDTTAAGEWGITTETGLMLAMDSFMAQFRVDEETGLYLYYHDQLARLSGHNLQIRSATNEKEDFDDEGEINSIESYSPFVWETLGSFKSTGETVYDLFTSDITQNAAPYLATNEPYYNDQQPFWRYQEFKGYLGQASKRIVRIPYPGDMDSGDNTLNRYSVRKEWPGVFEESLLLSGRYLLTSAKGIIIAKRSIRPSPKQMARPEDTNADVSNPDFGLSPNYLAAGTYGGGSEIHHVDGEIALPLVDPDNPLPQPALIRPAALLDEIVYTSNWEQIHPFVYHRRDWYIPEENDMKNTPDDPAFWTQANVLEYEKLKKTQYLKPVDPLSFKVDKRYGSVKYYNNMSYIAMLDDGGLVISDGYESEIRMAGGSIHLACPGDIWLQPGRNVNAWAGNDMNFRARKSIDITTSKKDVRIKAEQNFMVRAGNDHHGGIMLESCSKCTVADTGYGGEYTPLGGILLKAAMSNVSIASKDVFITSSFIAQGLDTKSPYKGNIHLNAYGGNIRTDCKYLEHFVEPCGCIRQIFIQPNVNANDTLYGQYSVNEFWHGFSQFCSNVSVYGNLKIAFDTWLCQNVYIATDFHLRGGLYYGEFDQYDHHAHEDHYKDVMHARCQEDNNTIAPLEISTFGAYFRGDTPLFTFRAESEMGTVNYVDYPVENVFSIYESRWQHGSNTKVEKDKWDDEPGWANPYSPTDVRTIGGVYFPYPGYTYLTHLAPNGDPVIKAYVTVDSQLYDFDFGIAKNRADNKPKYDDPVYARPERHALKDYIVTRIKTDPVDPTQD